MLDGTGEAESRIGHSSLGLCTVLSDGYDHTIDGHMTGTHNCPPSIFVDWKKINSMGWVQRQPLYGIERYTGI